MTTNANELVELTRLLTEKLGEPATTLIMARLPDDPSTNFATRDDVAANTIALRGEMAEMRAELRGEMTELRGEMTELRSELRSEMTELRTELRSEMAELRTDVRTEMAEGFTAQQRFLTTSLIAVAGLNVASIGVAVGLVAALG